MLLEGAPALSSFEVPILAKKLFIDLKITRVIEGGGGRIGREREAAGGRLFFFFWGGGRKGSLALVGRPDPSGSTCFRSAVSQRTRHSSLGQLIFKKNSFFSPL